MNSDALEHWFTEHDIEHERLSTGAFALQVRQLDNDTIREIGACGGGIRLHGHRIIVEER